MEELTIAIKYSYEAMTWITWLVLAILIGRAIISFSTAYKDNNSYETMKNNKDKKAIAQFYSGVVLSIVSIVVFFLPYLINYKG